VHGQDIALGGDLDPGRLITIVLAGFGVLSMTGMGMEAFDIEHGMRDLTAVEELEARYPTLMRRNAKAKKPLRPTDRHSEWAHSTPLSERR
jgi:ATP-binding cassette, subfamily B, bacterial